MTDEGTDEDGGRTARESDTGESGGGGDAPNGGTDGDDVPLLKPSLRTFPWLRAAAAAAVTVAVQYALVALAFVAGPSSLDAPIFDSMAERLLQYAFLLYNAHHVPMVTTATNAQVPGSGLTNALYGASGGSIPAGAFFALPAVSLLIAGALFEFRRRGDRSESELEESALVGTGFALGYAVVGTAASLFLVRRITFEGGSAATGPAILWALIMTVLFPLVFASIGAAVAFSYDEARTEAQALDSA